MNVGEPRPHTIGDAAAQAIQVHREPDQTKETEMKKLTLALVTAIFIACVNPRPSLGAVSDRQLELELIEYATMPCVRMRWDNASYEGRENFRAAFGPTTGEVLANMVKLMHDLALNKTEIRKLNNLSLNERKTEYSGVLNELIKAGACEASLSDRQLGLELIEYATLSDRQLELELIEYATMPCVKMQWDNISYEGQINLRAEFGPTENEVLAHMVTLLTATVNKSEIRKLNNQSPNLRKIAFSNVLRELIQTGKCSL